MLKRISTLLILLVLITGCQSIKIQPRTVAPSPTVVPPATPKQAFSPSEAIGVVEDYLFALVRRDDRAARAFLTETGKRDHIVATSNPHPNGFHVVEGDFKDAVYEVEAVVDDIYTGNPFYSATSYQIQVVKDNDRLLINGISRQDQVTLMAKGNALVLSHDGSEQKLFELNDLPKEMTPQGAEVTTLFGIGRNSFSPVALSPDRKLAAFATVGTHGMVGVYDLVARKLIPVDLYYGGTVSSLAWSVSSERLAVEVNTPAGVTSVYAYDHTLKRIETKIRATAPIPQYSINTPGFFGEKLAYNLVPVEASADKSLAGWYLYDFVKNECKKLQPTP